MTYREAKDVVIEMADCSEWYMNQWGRSTILEAARTIIDRVCSTSDEKAYAYGIRARLIYHTR